MKIPNSRGVKDIVDYIRKSQDTSSVDTLSRKIDADDIDFTNHEASLLVAVLETYCFIGTNVGDIITCRMFIDYIEDMRWLKENS